MPPMGQFKNEAPLQEMILRKKSKSLETTINSFVSLINQHWIRMAEIPQKCDFFTWSNSKNF